MATDQPEPPVIAGNGGALTSVVARRHDLDALRASAMLLGIAYHVALSFATDFPWLVQDSQPAQGYTIFQYLVHGFRMPLFFLISGFFTAMLWRKRGLKALIGHRFRRILLPCLLGLITVVPAMFVVAGLAIRSGAQTSASSTPERGDALDGIWQTIINNDTNALEAAIAEGADVNRSHPQWAVTPLTLAALFGHDEMAEALIARGAEVNAHNRDGGTALHAAAFLGRSEVAGVLIRNGADIRAKNARGETAMDVAGVDWPMTQFLANMLRIPVEQGLVEAGRAEVIQQLRAQGDNGGPAVGPPESRPGKQGGASQILGAITLGLLFVPVFHHLWFLWFLWWLVLAFSLYFLIADWRGWRGPPRGWVLSPVRLLWLVPLTMLFQWPMGLTNAGFGPDTSVGLLPMPHVFVYYGIFFGFGVFYHDADDRVGRLGAGWRWTLPLALLVVFPLGLELCTGSLGFGKHLELGPWKRFAAVALQVLYAWLMTFACMGLFRSLLTRENKTIRWLSDASYWLYVSHLPLVILAQLWVRDWPLAGTIKFLLVNVVIIGFLLLTYQWMVRYTWLGTLLNGKRTRSSKLALQPVD